MYDVTALGELLIDFTPGGRDSVGNPVFTAIPGGAPANFLAALSRCGKKCAMIAKVGDDFFGSMLRERIESAGVDSSGVLSDPDVFTTLAFVTLSETGERSFSFARKPGADTSLRPEDLPETLLRDTKVFHFGTLSMTDEPVKSATRRAIALAKEAGAILSFDPNYRAPLWQREEDAIEAIRFGLSQADLVKISDNEAELLKVSFEALAEQFLQGGGKVIFITCGREGAWYFGKNGSGFLPAFRVATIDTVGAGDIFGGSALAQLLSFEKPLEALSKDELEKAVRYASAAAAISTTRHGAIPSIPSPTEVEDFLKNN